MKYPYGKNVFLTGGSSGIGLATAELLAAGGYTVYAASRNPQMSKEHPNGGRICPITLDVRDPKSVETAASDVLSSADIGIIIHCAGVGIACPAEDYHNDAVERLMQTNYNGVLRVNNRFLPHLRGRGGGLCIIVGSLAGILPIPYQSHYCASKAALDLYAAALRMELSDFAVRVTLVMPGDTNTGFTDARSYEIDETSPFYSACLSAVSKMEKDERSGRPPESSARAILRLSTKRNPPARLIVGFNYKLLAFLKRLLPDRLAECIIKAIYLGP